MHCRPENCTETILTAGRERCHGNGRDCSTIKHSIGQLVFLHSHLSSSTTWYAIIHADISDPLSIENDMPRKIPSGAQDEMLLYSTYYERIFQKKKNQLSGLFYCFTDYIPADP